LDFGKVIAARFLLFPAVKPHFTSIKTRYQCLLTSSDSFRGSECLKGSCLSFNVVKVKLFGHVKR